MRITVVAIELPIRTVHLVQTYLRNQLLQPQVLLPELRHLPHMVHFQPSVLRLPSIKFSLIPALRMTSAAGRPTSAASHTGLLHTPNRFFPIPSLRLFRLIWPETNVSTGQDPSVKHRAISLSYFVRSSSLSRNGLCSARKNHTAYSTENHPPRSTSGITRRFPERGGHQSHRCCSSFRRDRSSLRSSVA